LELTDIVLLPFDRGISVRRSSVIAAMAHSKAMISTYSNIKSEFAKEVLRDTEKEAARAWLDPILAQQFPE